MSSPGGQATPRSLHNYFAIGLLCAGQVAGNGYRTYGEAEAEAWLIETYGRDMANRIAASKPAVADLPEGLEGAMAELERLESALAAAYEAGEPAGAAVLHDLCEDHRAFMSRLWGKPCPPDAYEGLGQMYLSPPDFVVRYERISPRFSHWLAKAMAAHAARLGRA